MPNDMRQHVKRLRGIDGNSAVIWTLSGIVIAACGGGGGSSTTASTDTPPTNPISELPSRAPTLTRDSTLPINIGINDLTTQFTISASDVNTRDSITSIDTFGVFTATTFNPAGFDAPDISIGTFVYNPRTGVIAVRRESAENEFFVIGTLTSGDLRAATYQTASRQFTFTGDENLVYAIGDGNTAALTLRFSATDSQMLQSDMLNIVINITGADGDVSLPLPMPFLMAPTDNAVDEGASNNLTAAGEFIHGDLNPEPAASYTYTFANADGTTATDGSTGVRGRFGDLTWTNTATGGAWSYAITPGDSRLDLHNSGVLTDVFRLISVSDGTDTVTLTEGNIITINVTGSTEFVAPPPPPPPGSENTPPGIATDAGQAILTRASASIIETARNHYTPFLTESDFGDFFNFYDPDSGATFSAIRFTALPNGITVVDGDRYLTTTDNQVQVSDLRTLSFRPHLPPAADTHYDFTYEVFDGAAWSAANTNPALRSGLFRFTVEDNPTLTPNNPPMLGPNLTPPGYITTPESIITGSLRVTDTEGSVFEFSIRENPGGGNGITVTGNVDDGYTVMASAGYGRLTTPTNIGMISVTQGEGGNVDIWSFTFTPNAATLSSIPNLMEETISLDVTATDMGGNGLDSRPQTLNFRVDPPDDLSQATDAPVIYKDIAGIRFALVLDDETDAALTNWGALDLGFGALSSTHALGLYGGGAGDNPLAYYLFNPQAGVGNFQAPTAPRSIFAERWNDADINMPDPLAGFVENANVSIIRAMATVADGTTPIFYNGADADSRESGTLPIQNNFDFYIVSAPSSGRTTSRGDGDDFGVYFENLFEPDFVIAGIGFWKSRPEITADPVIRFGVNPPGTDGTDNPAGGYGDAVIDVETDGTDFDARVYFATGGSANPDSVSTGADGHYKMSQAEFVNWWNNNTSDFSTALAGVTRARDLYTAAVWNRYEDDGSGGDGAAGGVWDGIFEEIHLDAAYTFGTDKTGWGPGNGRVADIGIDFSDADNTIGLTFTDPESVDIPDWVTRVRITGDPPVIGAGGKSGEITETTMSATETGNTPITGSFAESTGIESDETETWTFAAGTSNTFAAIGSGLAGTYGTLTFAESTRTWTYTLGTTPTQLAALNIGFDSGTRDDVFRVRLSDGTRADVETITIEVTGTEEPPNTAPTAFPGPDFAEDAGSPNSAFAIFTIDGTDPDGDDITYTIETVNGGYGLSFDNGATSRTNAPAIDHNVIDSLSLFARAGFGNKVSTNAVNIGSISFNRIENRLEDLEVRFRSNNAALTELGAGGRETIQLRITPSDGRGNGTPVTVSFDIVNVASGTPFISQSFSQYPFFKEVNGVNSSSRVADNVVTDVGNLALTGVTYSFSHSATAIYNIGSDAPAFGTATAAATAFGATFNTTYGTFTTTALSGRFFTRTYTLRENTLYELDEGERVQERITITLTDGTNTSTSHYVVTIDGTDELPDDPPMIGAGGRSGRITESDDSLTETENTPITGRFGASEGIEANEVASTTWTFAAGTSDTFAAIGSGIEGTYGNLTFDETTRTWTYTLGVTSTQLGRLNAADFGANVERDDVFRVRLDDGTGDDADTETITITVTGAADTAVPATGNSGDNMELDAYDHYFTLGGITFYDVFYDANNDDDWANAEFHILMQPLSTSGARYTARDDILMNVEAFDLAIGGVNSPHADLADHDQEAVVAIVNSTHASNQWAGRLRAQITDPIAGPWLHLIAPLGTEDSDDYEFADANTNNDFSVFEFDNTTFRNEQVDLAAGAIKYDGFLPPMGQPHPVLEFADDGTGFFTATSVDKDIVISLDVADDGAQSDLSYSFVDGSFSGNTFTVSGNRTSGFTIMTTGMGFYGFLTEPTAIGTLAVRDTGAGTVSLTVDLNDAAFDNVADGSSALIQLEVTATDKGSPAKDSNALDFRITVSPPEQAIGPEWREVTIAGITFAINTTEIPNWQNLDFAFGSYANDTYAGIVDADGTNPLAFFAFNRGAGAGEIAPTINRADFVEAWNAIDDSSALTEMNEGFAGKIVASTTSSASGGVLAALEMSTNPAESGTGSAFPTARPTASTLGDADDYPTYFANVFAGGTVPLPPASALVQGTATGEMIDADFSGRIKNGTSTEILVGGAGADTIDALGGSDYILPGAGADIVNLETGTRFGSGKPETIYVRFSSSDTGGFRLVDGGDTINNFGRHEDRLVLVDTDTTTTMNTTSFLGMTSAQIGTNMVDLNFVNAPGGSGAISGMTLTLGGPQTGTDGQTLTINFARTINSNTLQTDSPGLNFATDVSSDGMNTLLNYSFFDNWIGGEGSVDVIAEADLPTPLTCDIT